MNLCKAGTLSSTYTCMPMNKTKRIIFLSRLLIVVFYLSHPPFSVLLYPGSPALLFEDFLPRIPVADFENWRRVLLLVHKSLCSYHPQLQKPSRSSNLADSYRS